MATLPNATQATLPNESKLYHLCWELCFSDTGRCCINPNYIIPEKLKIYLHCLQHQKRHNVATLTCNIQMYTIIRYSICSRYSIKVHLVCYYFTVISVRLSLTKIRSKHKSFVTYHNGSL